MLHEADPLDFHMSACMILGDWRFQHSDPLDNFLTDECIIELPCNC
jgi:hypothetical protein